MLGRIAQISYDDAAAFLLPRHYSGRLPTISRAFGWFVDNDLKAVCTFGKPASPAPCRGVCGDKWATNVYELNRLCREEDFHEPLSHLVGTCLRVLKKENWIVISYSDTQMHHNGYIYQACNFIYTGLTKERLDVWNGKHARHYTKDDVKSDIRQIRSAKHRYVYFCTSDKKLKQQWLRDLQWPICPYPKGQNENYKLGDYMKPVLINRTTGEIVREESSMTIYTYDCEVTKYDWLVIFKDKQSGEFTIFHNDNDALIEFLDTDAIYAGFNIKHYDQYIIKAICYGWTPEEIKEVNDYIIGGGQGWEYPRFNGMPSLPLNNVDIRDDMQQGLSLKAIEGHFGLPIQETTISFDVDHPWSDDKLAEMIYYCKHDVNCTEELINRRSDYLKNKIHIGRMAGVDEVRAMGMTNAKLTAAMLKATRQEHDDERAYVYPENLKREYIPQEVFDFFNRMYDPNISDDDLWKGKLKVNIGSCPVTIGFGGIHGAIPNFIWRQEEHEDRIIRNFDVASYYPHLMTINGYTSRNCPSPEVFENVLDTRMKAKASGDKATANALKLVVNTTYGAMLNQYNDLYDPLMGRSVCISGQLYLYELSAHLVQEIPGLLLVQNNTDGIMIEFAKDQYDQVLAITKEWQERTGFELEEDSISRIAQKDVNNYCEVQPNGEIKIKGGYLVKGIAPAGAFNVNNNAVIVATALKEYFAHDVPVEDTINSCNDIMQFQIIAKAGAKYREAYHIVDGQKVSVQKVNRVYATTNERYGKLYKVKDTDDSEAKIESLPEHCIIDNNNELSIEDVDKSFYIEMAKKRVNDFLGIEPEKPIKKRRNKSMATSTAKSAPNVYGKLIEARNQFQERHVEKSGKNYHLKFDYFELKDIVPHVNQIFKEVGLVAILTFPEGKANLDIVNVDAPDQYVNFYIPFAPLTPIESKTGTAVQNEMQALGASITYVRRYLYLIALDIVEADEIDANLGSPEKAEEKKEEPKKATPATPIEREGIKINLTNVGGAADEDQIAALKKKIKELRTARPDEGDTYAAQIVHETEKFTKVTKFQHERYMSEMKRMIEDADYSKSRAAEIEQSWRKSE